VAVDEYGREPVIIDGTIPGSPVLRQKMFGKVLVVRPAPTPAPAWQNEHPES
jgi:hypothetical protein